MFNTFDRLDIYWFPLFDCMDDDDSPINRNNNEHVIYTNPRRNVYAQNNNNYDVFNQNNNNNLFGRNNNIFP